MRVLDLTRVIAGPVATRFLAAHGADWLDGLGRRPVDEPPPEPPDVASFVQAVDSAEWGSTTLVRPPGELASWQPRWAFPPPPAGAHRPTWPS